MNVEESTDHNSMIYTMENEEEEEGTREVKGINWDKFRYRLDRIINEIPRTETRMELELAIEKFERKVAQAIEESLSATTKTCRNIIKNLIEAKKRARRTAEITRTAGDRRTEDRTERFKVR